MKRTASGRGAPEGMKKLKLSVQQFVQKAGTAGAAPEQDAEYPGARGKSRKELRKEKRKAKKSRRREYYEWRHLGSGQMEPTGAQGTGEVRKPGAQGTGEVGKPGAQGTGEVGKTEGHGREEPKESKPVKKSPATGKPTKKNLSREEVRRKALLEANEKEEKEIKRLEKSLRMNKRKNKSSLPQAFAQDGLDYILGALEPGGAGLGLYEEEEEEVNTLEKLHRLSERMCSGSDSKGGAEGQEEGVSEGEDISVHLEAEGESEEDRSMDQEEGAESEEDEGEESEKDGSVDQVEEEGSPVLDGGDETDPPANIKTTQDTGNKYVPPQLRQSSDTLDAKRREELERLKKSVKGLMNR
ncbi:hypothetical protein FKM82_020681 [Ascaphus truei]